MPQAGANLNNDVIVQVYLPTSSALFNLQSLLTVVLLVICTCAYLKSFFPKVFDKSRTGSYTKDLLEMCKDRRKKVALGSSGMFDDGIYNTVFKRQHTEERGEMADAQQSAIPNRFRSFECEKLNSESAKMRIKRVITILNDLGRVELDHGPQQGEEYEHAVRSNVSNE
ncbi:hypothetical protein HUJ04_006476, partial [Dendroctonus ponderosae]